jgi:hypothetical protein
MRGGGWPTFGPRTLPVPRPRCEAVKKLVVFSLRESEREFLWIRSGGITEDLFFCLFFPSELRHTAELLLRLALARLTFSRMSLAFAVQIKGLGWRLCSSL